MRSCLVKLILTLSVASTVGCGYPGQGGRGKPGSESGLDAKVRVTPIKPLRKDLIRYCEQPGQVAAMEEAPLFAKVSGYVHKVHVDIGDKVQGPVFEGKVLKSLGQTLIEIEVPELEKEHAQKAAAVEQAKSEVKQSESAIKVAKAMRESALALVDETRATVDRADADYERWKSELARITDLAARQAVTDKLVDETQNKFRAAEAMRKEVAAKIRSAQAHIAESEAQVEKAEADLGAARAKQSVAEAERDRVQTLLSFAEIHAPFDGLVSARHVDTGHLVNVGSSAKEALLVVVSTGVVRVFVDVPEMDAVLIEPAAEATIRLPSFAAEKFVGKVTRTTWVLNQATRTLRTEIDVPNEHGRLRPGMYAHARLKVAERLGAITLPKSALMISAGQASCWRIEADGTVRRQVVQTGIESGGEFEVISGLTGDEEIIGQNVGAFRDGQIVEKLEPRPK